MALRTRRAAIALAAAAPVVIALAVAPDATAAPPPLVTDPASLVNPIIGTSGAVDDFPGADVPFGMVQWSPDTPSRPAGGGYEYRDRTVTGFSLTHISGPGCGAAGDVPILPTSGAVPAKPDAATLPLNHAHETAQAGYYSLTGDGITTELTSTTRSGMARFTFPSGPAGNLLLKLSDSQAGTDATSFQVVNNREISGSVTSGHFCGATDKYTVYFDMVFDHPFTGSGTWTNNTNMARGATSMTVRGRHGTASTPRVHVSSNGEPRVAPHIHDATGAAKPNAQRPVTGANGAYLSFDTATSDVLQAKVGISYVSTANARRNRAAENPDWDFDSVRSAAHDAWNNVLDKIEVGGGTDRDQTVFYTALYHALLHPNVYSDVNGQYMGFDGQVHRAASGHVEYANYSGWDIYRSQAQLEALVAPQQASDSARSMLDQYDQTGQLPKWELYNGESYVMVGDPADSILADYYAFGARDFDVQHALQAMMTEANQPNNVRPGLNYYLNDGYLPYDGTYGCCNYYGSVSTQQEYDVADNSIAELADALGDTSDASTYAARANNWQNVFNPGTGYLEAKYLDGQFQPGFTPDTSQGFVEADSAQYTPMEPQDIAGAIAADGGRAQWITKLNELTAKVKDPGPMNADFGNEPSIEIPWEYDYAGAPWRTQGVVRKIQQQIFTPEPAGIAGNDDLGTMSAWYVWSALGFYPETPGSAVLALGSPVFDRAVVSLPSGNSLTINGDGAATNAPYVQNLTLDGSSYEHAYLPASVVGDGGTLDFTLSSTPNAGWASAPADAPPSNTAGLYPALGYASESNVIATPHQKVTVDVGARSLTGKAQAVSWSATTPNSHMVVAPSSGTLQVRAAKDATQQVSLTAPGTEGRYLVDFAMRGGEGQALPKVVVELDVAKPGDLWPYCDNAGISDDGVSNEGDYDGDGWSYSAQQLADDGWTPGATQAVDGLSYTFPDTQPGDLDNIEAGGQTIPLSGTAGASRFGILGSATNASPGSEGDFVVTYTDGTSDTVHLGLSDWTLGGGGAPGPSYGNTIAADTPYRDGTDGSAQQIHTYLFTASGSIDPSKTVKSVTLPQDVSDGQLHVFAFATG
jgi:predicted alpha-1,2-mannosidase